MVTLKQKEPGRCRNRHLIGTAGHHEPSRWSLRAGSYSDWRTVELIRHDLVSNKRGRGKNSEETNEYSVVDIA